MRNYQCRVWYDADRVRPGEEPPDGRSFSSIEGSTATMLDIARAWWAQTGPQGNSSLAHQLLEACEQSWRIELSPDEMSLIDDGQGWWAPGDRVTLHSSGREVTLHVSLDAETRPENPNRIDRQHMETSADGEYETDEWMQRFLDLPARILDRLQAELAAQRLRIAVGEEIRLVPGCQYDPDYLRCVGWTDGDGTGIEGYSHANYFDGDRYLGPDEHGIEPVFAGLRWPA